MYTSQFIKNLLKLGSLFVLEKKVFYDHCHCEFCEVFLSSPFASSLKSKLKIIYAHGIGIYLIIILRCFILFL